jgi:succinate-semialdehyde dehydrogenase
MKMNANIDDLVKRSKIAGAKLETLDQKTLDGIVRAIAKVVYDNAEQLARMTVDETRMGKYEDKVLKCKGKSRIIWNALKNVKSRGIISVNETTGITEVAKPMGVIAAVTPTTNPVVTPMCNAMYAIKGANTIIVAPHPRAAKVNSFLAELIRKAVVEAGAPADIYLTLEAPTVEMTAELMGKADVVVATGGGAMVKAAYSSGKPSFGVGPGNVQVLLDRNLNLSETVEKILVGRTYDNGIICSAEQAVIVHKEDAEAVISQFQKSGAYYISKPEEVSRIVKILFPKGVISKDAVGQSVETLAKLVNIQVPAETRALLLEGADEELRLEKMFPVLAVYRYDSWEEAVEIAYKNLKLQGIGHSVSLHSLNQEHINYAAVRLPVSRIMVNQVSSTNVGGAFINGLNPTTTIGCGSWGNNSISENLFYKHLINVSRIAAVKKDAKIPNDDEIWGE